MNNEQQSKTPETDALKCIHENGTYRVGTLHDYESKCCTLEQQRDEARAKVEYAKRVGLEIGICTSSDCPEGRLAHNYKDDSELGRIFQEWTASIGLESENQLLTAQMTVMSVALKPFNLNMGPRNDDEWFEFYVGDVRRLANAISQAPTAAKELLDELKELRQFKASCDPQF